MMDKPAVTYYCNKCGYFGPTSAHVGCNYFACTGLTQQWADQLEAENARLREDLAAAQATIADVRSNLLAASCYIDCLGGNSKAYRIAHAIPTNQNALHEARALECERLAKAHGMGVMKWLCEEAAAHRARKQAMKEEGK